MDDSDLELHTDEKFQRIEWRAQRFGWAIWLLVLCAGLLGIFGSGPMSQAEVRDDAGRFTATFDRFARYHSPTQLKVALHEQGRSTADVHLTMSEKFLDRIQITRIEPQPVRSELTDNGITYAFAQTPELSSGAIVFHFDFERIGWSGGRIQLAGGRPVILNQFIYP